MTGVSVVIPVLNGGHLLDEALAAVRSQRVDPPAEVLVVDSGSTDDSVAIARRHGVRVHRIPNAEFGHGRTRNLAMSMTSGELVAFLTQDATPVDSDWLGTLVRPFEDPRVGASSGAQLPRRDARIRVARTVHEAFDRPRSVLTGESRDLPVFSDVNSCLRRDAWEQVRFRDVEYAEDYHLCRDLLAAGWHVAYEPDAAVWHSNRMTLVEHWGRMLDEVGALPRSTPPPMLAGVVRDYARQVGGDIRHARARRPDRLGRDVVDALVTEGHRAIAVYTYHRRPSAFARLHERWSLEKRRRVSPAPSSPGAPRSAAPTPPS